jgi:hypothetical protein
VTGIVKARFTDTSKSPHVAMVALTVTGGKAAVATADGKNRGVHVPAATW